MQRPVVGGVCISEAGCDQSGTCCKNKGILAAMLSTWRQICTMTAVLTASEGMCVRCVCV